MKTFHLALTAAAFSLLLPDLALAQRDDTPAVGGGVVNRSRDCHRNVVRHRIYGRLLEHRHVGANCRVEIMRGRDRRNPRCIIVDGKRYCRDRD